MGFRVIEQGNVSGLNSERDIFEARIEVDGLVFRISWNSSTFIEIYSMSDYWEVGQDYPEDIHDYKFSDIIEKIIYRKSKKKLLEYFIMGMDKIIYNAKYGKLNDICEYIESTDSCYEPIDGTYYPERDEMLLFDGIIATHNLVSRYGIRPNNDNPRLRDKLIKDLQNEKQNIIEKIQKV